MLCIISIELWIGSYVVAGDERWWWSGGKMCQSYGKCFWGEDERTRLDSRFHTNMYIDS